MMISRNSKRYRYSTNNYAMNARDSMRAKIETLEDRLLLSWLTVLIHGQTQSAYSEDVWMRDVVSAIDSLFTDCEFNYEQSVISLDDSINTRDEVIDASNDWRRRNIGTEQQCGEIMVVDWPQAHTLPPLLNIFSTPGVADDIGVRLGLLIGNIVRSSSIRDVHLIGFSRGAYIASNASAMLTEIGSGNLDDEGFFGEFRFGIDAETEDLIRDFDTTGPDFQPPTTVYQTTIDAQSLFSDGELARWGVDRWENYYQIQHLRPDGEHRFPDGSNPDFNVDLSDTRFVRSVIGHGDPDNWFASVLTAPSYGEHWHNATVNGRPIDYIPALPILGHFNLTEPVKGDFPTPRVAGIRTIREIALAADDHDDHADEYDEPPIHQIRTATSTTSVGSIETAGDSDLFEVFVSQNGRLKVETGAGIFGSSLRSQIAILDTEGRLIESHSANGAGYAAQIFLENVAAGQVYRVRVSGVGGSTGAYHLLVSQPSAGSQRPSDPAETPPPPRVHNDSAGSDFPSARQIALDGSNKGDDATRLDAAGDVDYFVFEANTTGEIEIDVDPQGPLITIATLFDAQLDEDGNGQPDGVDSDASDGADGISHFLYNVIAGGTYYLRVESQDQDRTGEYEVHIRPLDPDSQPGGSGTDGPPGPLPGWGGVRGVQINLDASGNGASRGGIDDPAEVEWFQIDGAHAGFMEIRVQGDNDDLSPFITVFRADGGGIDTDSGEFDDQAKVAFEVEDGERIIVAVSSANGRSTGTFTIQVLQPDSLPDDDTADFGPPETAEAVTVSDEGNGFIRRRIEAGDGGPEGDTDWFKIPVRGTGLLTVQVQPDESGLVPFLRLSRDGTSGGFFESDDGRDGQARITFLPDTAFIWAKVSALDGTLGEYTLSAWRSSDPNDDHPDSGGVHAAQRELDGSGFLFVPGRISNPGDKDSFRILVPEPGPVSIEVISLTQGFTAALHASWQTADYQGNSDTDAGSRPTGRTHIVIDNILPADDNWINIDVGYQVEGARGNGTQQLGDYLLFVRQLGNRSDADPETVGIEASPLLLDGTGNGSLPGAPNNNEAPPALEYAGDIDTFQVIATSDRPITFTVDGTGINGGTFLRVYDANRQPIVGDHNSGPNGESMITLEAFRGDLYYLEVQAFDGTSTGDYSITVEQPRDDHPDALTFVDGASLPNTGDFFSVTRSVVNPANGHVYHLLQSSDGLGLTWTEAEAAAVELGGHLVTVNDLEENDWIAANFSHPYLWIGLSDAVEEGTFSWSSGESSSFRNWWPGEPNNFGGDEDFVHMYNFSGGNWQWNDHIDSRTSGNWPLFAIAEVRPMPAPIVLDSLGIGTATGRIGTTDANNSLVGDRDVFQITALDRGQITIDVVTTDNQLDTFLRVYDSRENLVAIDDDGGDGRNSRVTFNTFMDEAYLIEVSGYADNSIGAYRVDVQRHEIPRETFIGTYDDFAGGRISDARFRTTTTGSGVVEQTGGAARLQANGNRAEDDNNRAVLESRAYILGDVEFDFSPWLGSDENAAQIEFTNGTDFIRLLMEPDGAGGISLTVDSSGYTELTNGGAVSLVQEQSYHLELSQDGGTVAISIDGGSPVATFEGPLKAGTALRGQAQSRQRPIYDDFNDNSIDPNRWNTSGDVFEQGGRLHVWMYRNGGLRDSRATTQGELGGTNIRGFFLHSDRTARTVGPGQAEAWVGITNGPDYVRFRWLNDVNHLTVETGGVYGERHPAARWDPDDPGPAETPDGPLEIRERNGNIEFVHNGTVRYTIHDMSIQAGSWFEVVAFGQNGENGPLNRDYELMIDNLRLYTGVGRFAELAFDNLAGEFALPNDPVIRAYDDFNDNQIDFERWQISGSPREEDGQLKLPLYGSGEPLSAYVSTAGVPGGTNLRGFRVGTNRTATPQVISDRDTTAHMELTNGVDYIRIGWTMRENSFFIKTGGSYGSRQDEIPIPDDQIPDGPIEVRERDGNIEVLHNGNLQFAIPNQTVRAGSYFTFQTDGDPERRNLRLEGIEFYDAIIDNLEFYYDPEPYDVAVAPSLLSESDSGFSNTDHVTNQLSLQFDWTAGPEGTRYQWREGELLEGGSIDYNAWSNPQTETTAQVDLSGASIHVISVRTISSEGTVGQATARAVSVDIDPPSVDGAIRFVDGQPPRLIVQFDEPVFGAVGDVAIRRSDGSLFQPTSVTGFGATRLEMLLPANTPFGDYTFTLEGVDGLTDVAGNALDGDRDGSPGGDFQGVFQVPVFLEGSLVTAAGGGGGPHVRVFSADGQPRFDFMAYSIGFTGGVRVATGDVNGDDVPDIITGAGPGGGPHVRVFDGRDGSPLESFFPYQLTFAGGVFVAAATPPIGQALRASAHTFPAALDGDLVSLHDIREIAGAAINRLQTSVLTPEEVDELQSVEYSIADLPGNLLGVSRGRRIIIDQTAAGYGWFIDPTPESDEEFAPSSLGQELIAIRPSGIDLVTVLFHELGHVLGWRDLGDEEHSHDLMSAILPENIRRLPDEVDAVFGDQQLIDELFSVAL